jgi:hypothetical protein
MYVPLNGRVERCSRLYKNEQCVCVCLCNYCLINERIAKSAEKHKKYLISEFVWPVGKCAILSALLVHCILEHGGRGGGGGRWRGGCGICESCTLFCSVEVIDDLNNEHQLSCS